MSNINTFDQYAPYQKNDINLNNNNTSDTNNSLTYTNSPVAPRSIYSPPQPQLTQLTIGQYLINMKNAIFGIGTDLVSQGFQIDIFTKDNRLFYIGLFFIIIFIVYLFILNLATCY
ncbi:hypothetical protein QJ857_gp0913 [Tupanvirus soda lake]|uniref:Uncharacterized protein n=2 Tax=Tupanvirus TaxID=2094720 RepID=A0A6N1NK64_9VIRU|nr:hypothetical protein QJ857_gp0913 [Tupanvirus soda lake]QKU35139.1 hypothetical protein [Tupanvirus soda lake]